MSLLAEPRRKQKISSDPQNRHWTKDGDKFGSKLLNKLGWKEGEGLGANQTGISAPIRLKPNSGQTGLGSGEINYDRIWIEHQDDFNSVLSGLNSHSKTDSGATVVDKPKWSLEEKSKSSRMRIHYHKYARMKDLSGRSASDLACIIASRKPVKKVGVEEEKVGVEVELKPAEVEANFNGKISVESSSDYFARRLTEIKAGRTEVKVEENLEEIEEKIAENEPIEDVEVEVKQKKKRKKEKLVESVEEVEVEVELEESKKQKRKKKKRNTSESNDV